MLRPVILLALAVAAAPAYAEMYRYRDPETGQMKLTNIPPPWMGIAAAIAADWKATAP